MILHPATYRMAFMAREGHSYTPEDGYIATEVPGLIIARKDDTGSVWWSICHVKSGLTTAFNFHGEDSLENAARWLLRLGTLGNWDEMVLDGEPDEEIKSVCSAWQNEIRREEDLRMAERSFVNARKKLKVASAKGKKAFAEYQRLSLEKVA